jgi:hypothetical protein
MLVACMWNPHAPATEPLLNLQPSPRDRLRALIDSRICHDPEKPERRFPRQRDPRGFVQLCIEPASRGFVVRRSQIPRVDQEIDIDQEHLFMRLAFCFGEYLPCVVQIRKIAFSQINRSGSKLLFINSGLSHAFEPLTQGLVYNLFQSRISFFLNLLEKYNDIIIETQGGSHTSKHTTIDALMPAGENCSSPRTRAAQTSTPRGRPRRSILPV